MGVRGPDDDDDNNDNGGDHDDGNMLLPLFSQMMHVEKKSFDCIMPKQVQ